MAALSITAANVRVTQTSDIAIDLVEAGEDSIIPGKAVYLDTTVNKYKLADANLSAAAAQAVGIAVSYADNTEYFHVLTRGVFNIGATLSAGTAYIVGDTAGSIHPIADAASGWSITVLGVATTASLINLQVNAYDVTI